MANPIGRPPKLTTEERGQLYEEFRAYIRQESDPTTVGFVTSNEFALSHLISRDNISDWGEFSTLQKLAAEKQEAFLLKNMGNGTYNATAGIFRLKQPIHGYTDRTEIKQEVTGNLDIGAADPEKAAKYLEFLKSQK